MQFGGIERDTLGGLKKATSFFHNNPSLLLNVHNSIVKIIVP